MELGTCTGDWALITGASSGIGREFAHQLSAAGLNLVLVARRKPLLDDLAVELSQRHGIRVVAISVDLSHPGALSAAGSRMVAEEDVRVRLLCNNRAFGSSGPSSECSSHRVPKGDLMRGNTINIFRT